MLLAENGISPAKVHFSTDLAGLSRDAGAAPGWRLERGVSRQPYVTIAEEEYGMQVVADLNQGATMNFPIDGYVVTQSWAKAHPDSAVAFVRAIEQGQNLAAVDPAAADAAMAKSDALPRSVTSVISLPGFPTGPVTTSASSGSPIPCCSSACSPKDASEVQNGSLVKSMIGSLAPKDEWPGRAYGSSSSSQSSAAAAVQDWLRLPSGAPVTGW